MKTGSERAMSGAGNSSNGDHAADLWRAVGSRLHVGGEVVVQERRRTEVDQPNFAPAQAASSNHRC